MANQCWRGVRRLAVVASAGLLVASGLMAVAQMGVAWAGAPPTATPTVPALLAPMDVEYDEDANVVRWTDTNENEEGYRLSVTFGYETRQFETGPDVEELQLPDDFRPACPTPGPDVSIEVVAFLRELESEPGVFAFGAVCPIATLTPAPEGTEASALPDTGAGTGSSSALPVAAVALLAGAGLLAAAAGARAVSRKA